VLSSLLYRPARFRSGSIDLHCYPAKLSPEAHPATAGRTAPVSGAAAATGQHISNSHLPFSSESAAGETPAVRPWVAASPRQVHLRLRVNEHD
jgi:hypothetical protein